MDGNSPLMPQFANVPEISALTVPEMPNVQQEFVSGLQGINTQINTQLQAQKQKQDEDRQKALEAFEFHRKYTGNKDLAWQSFLGSGKLPKDYTPTKEDRKLFDQEMESDQQKTRMSLYGDQLTDAQKRGDADSIIKLTEQIYGQPLDETRKEYIQRSARSSRIKEIATIVEDLKNTPATVSFPIVSELLKSAGMPVPTFEDYVKTYYLPKATGTQSNVTAQYMRQFLEQGAKSINEDRKTLGDIDSQIKYTPSDGGVATIAFKRAQADRERLLLAFQGAVLSGNDAGLVNDALTKYNDFMTNSYLPARTKFYESRGIGMQGQGMAANIAYTGARTQLTSAQTDLARAKRQEVLQLLPIRANELKTKTDLALRRIIESKTLLGDKAALLNSQAELNNYLQSNSQRMWQSALGMLGRQERADIEAGKTDQEITAARQGRLQQNLDAVVELEVELRDKGVDRKYMSTHPGRALALKLRNSLDSGEALDTIIPGVPGLPTPGPGTGGTGKSAGGAVTTQPAVIPKVRPGENLPASNIGQGRRPNGTPVVDPSKAAEMSKRLKERAKAPLAPSDEKARKAREVQDAKDRAAVIADLRKNFPNIPVTEEAIQAGLQILRASRARKKK